MITVYRQITLVLMEEDEEEGRRQGGRGSGKRKTESKIVVIPEYLRIKKLSKLYSDTD